MQEGEAEEEDEQAVRFETNTRYQEVAGTKICWNWARASTIWGFAAMHLVYLLAGQRLPDSELKMLILARSGQRKIS